MQGGTQVFASAVTMEQPAQQQQQPAAKIPKHIVPEPISAAPAVGPMAAGGDSTATGALPPASNGNGAAGQAAAAKAVKRITPIPVSGPVQQQQQAPSSRPAPTESGSMVGAASKQAKRITPTPLKAGGAAPEQFGNAKQVRSCLQALS